MEARFRRPVYDGDEVRVEAVAAAEDALELTVHNGEGILCASGRATRRGDTPPPAPQDFPRMALPVQPPPPAGAEHFDPHRILGTLESPWSADMAQAYLDSVDEASPLLRDGGVAPPGWLVRLTDFVLVANVTLGPWIFAEARLVHHSLLRDGETLSARARVAERFDRGGHRFVALDLLFTAAGDRPVLSGRKVAIWQPATRLH